MEPQYRREFSGQEVATSDLTGIGDNAALADDHTLAELLRLAPYEGTPEKIIIPFATNAAVTIGNLKSNSQTVESSGAADAKVRIRPFRAVIGSRSAISSGTETDNWRDIRSVIHSGTGGVPYTEIQIPATTSNNRWTLIWAKVDIDVLDATVPRFKKDPSTGAITSVNTSVLKRTLITIGKTDGAEATNPVRPTIPSDTATSFYIPLAYIRVAHAWTLTSTVLANLQMHEAAPIVRLDRALGVSSLAPANHLHKVGGSLLTVKDWSNITKPGSHLPPAMVGSESRLILLNSPGGAQPSGMVLNGNAILDDSIDWRRRLFRWMCATNSAIVDYPWTAAGGGFVPSVASVGDGVDLAYGVGQSFKDDGTATIGSAGGLVAGLVQASNLSALAAGSAIYLWVEESSGNLKVHCNNTDPACAIFLWLDASGPWKNGI